MNLEVTEMPSASAYAKGRPVSRKIQHRAINVGERVVGWIIRCGIGLGASTETAIPILKDWL